MTIRTALFASIAAATLTLLPTASWSQSATPEPSAPAPYTPPAAALDGSSAAPADAAATPAPAAPEPAAPAADAAAPTAGDGILAAVEALPPPIEDVQIVGPWTDGDKSGVWRTVMTQVGPTEKETYRFFIQQIDKSDGATRVMTTTEIKEVSSVKGAIVGYRADEPSQDDTTSLTLFFDIVPSDGEIAETYELHYFKDQPYTFGPATN